ncbi:hypothetical protein [Bacillus toyonensis]|uniref:hypothetical protein n=1 Tax=Bacillus toyonensis TaxID=155322 RepID=UPI003D64B529
MKSKIHPFSMIVSNEDIAVGNKVKLSDGGEGTVTSIRSITFISMTKVEIIGRAKFENSTN